MSFTVEKLFIINLDVLPSGLYSCVAGEFVVYLALELVGPWVVLGFSVGMEEFDELLSINVPWSQEFSSVLRIWT